jgi:hypothetical protein
MKHTADMGETGAGITSEDQIDMEKPNAFTNKWGTHNTTQLASLSLILPIEQIREQFPWYFEMKDLVSERPNVKPVGIGNSGSEIDMGGYLGKSDDEETPHSCPLSEDENEGERDQECNDVELKDEDDDSLVSTKRKFVLTKKTAARSGSSTPAIKHKPKKARTVVEKFSDVAKAQEETVQKSLDMKMKRIEANKETNIARIKAREQIRVEKERVRKEIEVEKIRLERDKLQMEHEIRMAQLGMSRGASTSIPFSLPSGPYTHFPTAMASEISSTPGSTSSFTSPASSSVNLGLEFDSDLFLPGQKRLG